MLPVGVPPPQKTSLNLPLMQKEGVIQEVLTGPRSTASWDMMVNIRLLLLPAISSGEEVDVALTLTLSLGSRKG